MTAADATYRDDLGKIANAESNADAPAEFDTEAAAHAYLAGLNLRGEFVATLGDAIPHDPTHSVRRHMRRCSS